MKTVHTADMVAHLWANRSQDTARTSTQNFWFTGAALYSYGSHFLVAAHLEDGRVLLNADSYGNITGMHHTLARRAMGRVQMGNAISVPRMSYDDFRDLERIRESGEGKKLPVLAKICADKVVDIVQSMSKIRMGAARIESAFHSAKYWEKSGIALCEYVAKGKKAPKFPLGKLPESMPSSKEAMAAFIREFAKTRLIENHNTLMASCVQRIEQLRDIVATGMDAQWRINNVRGMLAALKTETTRAATEKNSAKVRAVIKEIDAIEPAAIALAVEFESACARKEMRGIVRDGYKALRARATKPNNYHSRVIDYFFVSKMNETMRKLPKTESEQFEQLRMRLTRCHEWDTASNYLESAIGSIESAESYLPSHTADSLSSYREAMGQIAQCVKHAQFSTLHAARINELRDKATANIEELRAELAEKHARSIADWKAGITNVRPSYESGTFARIKGDIVETSRGATVPLVHACRLARIARRIIQSGGKTWSNGDGPMIGAFRVNSIDASGRAVIGCHEFESSESLRMLELLDSCEACKGEQNV